jgi:hypothetical protein
VQPLKQTVDEFEGFLVVIKIHFSFPFLMIKQCLSWRKTEGVDLSLWQTPALSGTQFPTRRCNAKKPTLPLWHA